MGDRTLHVMLGGVSLRKITRSFIPNKHRTDVWTLQRGRRALSLFGRQRLPVHDNVVGERACAHAHAQHSLARPLESRHQIMSDCYFHSRPIHTGI